MTLQIDDPDTLLDSLCGQPRESDWLEFKQNKFDQESVGKYVSALANSAMFHGEDYAYLVYGVEDATHLIVGTNVNIDGRLVGNELYLFWLRKMLDPCIAIQYLKFNYRGLQQIEMLCIHPGYQKPVKFKGQSYIRIESSQQSLNSHPELERAIWQITSRHSFESMIVSSNAHAEIVLDRFRYAPLLRLLKKNYDTPAGAVACMIGLGLISQNLQRRYDVKAICALACAKDLDNFQTLTGKSARVVVYKSSNKLSALSDQEGKQGYIVSFSRLLAYIMEKIPHEEILLHGIRTIVYEIPEIAIREFLANAIIHQDFTAISGRPTIEVYSDKIRIINPGLPLVDPDRFIDSPSKSRNKEFASLMRAAGLCEERGSGVDRALSEIERASLPPPLIQSVEGSTIVTVFKRRPFSELSAEDRIRACYQHACLRHEAGDRMSNMSLRTRFGLNSTQTSQVSVVIREAIAAGRIRPLNMDQPNRVARYVPYWAG